MLGNPHSKWGGPAGFSAIDAAARQVTLDMCGAAPGEYECVFTSGATGTSRRLLRRICSRGLDVMTSGADVESTSWLMQDLMVFVDFV